ncbi:MAG: tRNA threonylcarbamoyladenosine dehydratase [Spirochaetia bacterium]|nr:tRNA threonylcarbamoyladenosine dehydratase [Spirochaetia bacterium]
MLNQFSRTELLLGKEAMEILNKAHVAVFGIGGVGGYTVEALVRSGIQHIDIIDNDTVSLTNLNRQIIATHSTIGKYKVDVMKDRILDINPSAEVNVHKCFYLPETRDLFDFTKYDYVVDAVDTVTAKINLILQAKEAGTKIICSMGAGNKMDPTQFQVADISQTSVCPLARVIRQECKKRKIKNVKVVFSTEKVLRPIEAIQPENSSADNRSTVRRDIPGSNAFVPSVAGLIIASEIIKDLTGEATDRARENI